ncbi:MAG TPA: succinylglutamate desuccinylase/aspartoacylase family protein [Verrucomicrobiae bacterium]|nr:succinylglutamate desuccinylase/aspartoacylase family protein [Verrucomicrobiae bacterium]
MNSGLEALIQIENGSRSLERLLAAARQAPGAREDSLGSFQSGGRAYSIPRFSFEGSNSSDPIRLGIFAAIHGDEPAGALAAIRFLQRIAAEPDLVENFHIEVYPVCNPTGFEDNTRHSRHGRDLNREFWRGSSEPEVECLEHELRNRHFSGIIQLHADDTSDGVYGFVRGHTLTENLLRPALCAAGNVLPRNANATIDGFAARDGIIREHYEGILAAPPRMDPMPFEIILETPGHAPIDLQVKSAEVALQTILVEYRRLIAFAANI